MKQKLKSRKPKKKLARRGKSKATNLTRLKRKAVFRVTSLDHSFSALLQWSQQVHGLTATVRRAAEELQESLKLTNAKQFISTVQTKRPILEELYVWKCEGTGQGAESDPARMKAHLEEGAVLVDALFDILEQEFQVRILREPGEKIATPKRASRDYRFQEKYRDGVSNSHVIFPGLRQGKTVISPCEIAQGEH